MPRMIGSAAALHRATLREADINSQVEKTGAQHATVAISLEGICKTQSPN